MVAQSFWWCADLAHDFFGSDCTRGLLDDVLGDGRKQLCFANHSSGKRSASYFRRTVPDRSSSDVSRRADFDRVYAPGAGLVLGAARFCVDHSCDCSANFKRGKNSSSGAGRLFGILPEHAVAAYPTSLVNKNRKRNLLVLVDAVHGDAAQHLGIKVGGLLRHHFSRGGDAHNLIDIDRIQEKRNLRCTAIDGVESSGGFALVAEISFGCDGLQGNAEGRLKNSVVQQDNIQLALQGRNAVKKLREIGAAPER